MEKQLPLISHCLTQNNVHILFYFYSDLNVKIILYRLCPNFQSASSGLKVHLTFD